MLSVFRDVPLYLLHILHTRGIHWDLSVTDLLNFIVMKKLCAISEVKLYW